MARGRPRKQGKREPNGRLQRQPGDVFDQGTERIKALRNRFGEHYSTALGRAYATGLLGEGQLAKDRLEAGKFFAASYMRIFGRPYRCPLNDAPRGSDTSEEQDDRGLRTKFRLFAQIDTIIQLGCRPFFDQLMQEGTEGPYWLDRLIAKTPNGVDKARLDAALVALDSLVPERKPLGILVSHY